MFTAPGKRRSSQRTNQQWVGGNWPNLQDRVNLAGSKTDGPSGKNHQSSRFCQTIEFRPIARSEICVNGKQIHKIGHAQFRHDYAQSWRKSHCFAPGRVPPQLLTSAVYLATSRPGSPWPRRAVPAGRQLYPPGRPGRPTVCGRPPVLAQFGPGRAAAATAAVPGDRQQTRAAVPGHGAGCADAAGGASASAGPSEMALPPQLSARPPKIQRLIGPVCGKPSQPGVGSNGTQPKPGK